MTRLDLPENFYKWVLDSFKLTVTVNREGRICHIGQSYLDVLGISREAAIGTDITEIIPNSRLPEIMESGQADYGSVFVMKNGQPVVVIRLPVFDEAGIVQGAISISGVSDIATITNLVEMVDQLQLMNERYRTQIHELKRKRYGIDKLIGDSPGMQQIKASIRKVADSDLSVLITGETGTGKELVANALHTLSSRRDEAYIKLNCAAIPKELMESELFGYTEGAFSGAVKAGKPGKFELANNGTILLDEVGEIPLELQGKLLRVLQEHEVERVGGLGPVALNVRVVCSTNRDLRRLSAEGLFRSDLYYRINVMELHMPPLRERREDIPALCEHLLQKINRNHGCFVNGLDDEVMDFFMWYEWPGNVRELEHSMERACVMTQSGVLRIGAFDFLASRTGASDAVSDPATLHARRQALEKQAILEALSKAHGNKSKAARELGITRGLLYEKLKRFDIEY